MNDKGKYIVLCETEPSIPIFMQNRWLDVVATEGGTWQVVLAFDDKNAIIGALTFVLKKKWGLTVLSEPFLSPFCGVWMKKVNAIKQHEIYHFEKKILTELIAQLPFFHFAHFRFSTTLTDWQPFYWAGFKQTTRYTYQLDLKTHSTLFSNFNQNTQRNIRKAEKKFRAHISDDLDTFLNISQLTFDRQHIKNPVPHSVWRNVDAFLKTNNQKKLYFAFDTEGVVEAAVYIIYDKQTAYYLAGGATETGRKQGVMHFLLHQAIEDAQKQGLEMFDFEGSMLQGVETFFRGFNGALKPYFKIWKYKNRYLEFLDNLRK